MFSKLECIVYEEGVDPQREDRKSVVLWVKDI